MDFYLQYWGNFPNAVFIIKSGCCELLKSDSYVSLVALFYFPDILIAFYS